MLTNIFTSLLITSFAGGVLVLLLCGIVPIMRKKCNANLIYYIWALVLAVMILPLRIELPESDVNNPVSIQNVELNYNTDANFDINNNESMEANTNTVPLKAEKNFNMGIVLTNGLQAASILWLIGFAVIFVYKIINYFIFVIKIKENCKQIQLNEFSNRLNKRIRVYMSDDLLSPLMIGVFKPMLLLPHLIFSQKHLENIISHEMVHFQRCDVGVKWFGLFVKSILWFNPIVYFVFHKVNEECEISCDAIVTRNMSIEEKKGYAQTILSLLSTDSLRQTCLSTTMAGNIRMLKKRFIIMKDSGKKSKFITIISATIVLLFVVCVSIVGAIFNGRIIRMDEETAFLVMDANEEINLDMKYMTLAQEWAESRIPYVEAEQINLKETYSYTDFDKSTAQLLAARVEQLVYVAEYQDYILFKYKSGWLPDDASLVFEVGGLVMTYDGWLLDDSLRYLVFINTESPKVIGEFHCEFSPDGNSEQFYKDFDMWISRLATEQDRGLPLSREDALEILKEQLIIAYENTYGEFVPQHEDPGSMSGDKERLPYIIENLEITEFDGIYYTVPVIWDFLIEIESGKIYKYYDGLDKMLIPFEPLDKNALSFAG